MSLDKFFAPRSVAIVGASREKGKVGYEILTNMVAGGFPGKIFPVNAKAEEIDGVRCFPDLAAIGETTVKEQFYRDSVLQRFGSRRRKCVIVLCYLER